MEQGSRNYDSLAAGLGGKGDREEMGGKNSHTRANKGVFALKKVKNGPNSA